MLLVLFRCLLLLLAVLLLLLLLLLVSALALLTFYKLIELTVHAQSLFFRLSSSLPISVSVSISSSPLPLFCTHLLMQI